MESKAKPGRKVQILQTPESAKRVCGGVVRMSVTAGVEAVPGEVVTSPQTLTQPSDPQFHVFPRARPGCGM